MPISEERLKELEDKGTQWTEEQEADPEGDRYGRFVEDLPPEDVHTVRDEDGNEI